MTRIFRELCDAIGAPGADHASHDAATNAYTFERRASPTAPTRRAGLSSILSWRPSRAAHVDKSEGEALASRRSP